MKTIITSPLIMACSSEFYNITFAKTLVEYGADVNYQNEFGQSALSESVMVDEYKVAYYLLQNGADYNRPIYYRFDYSVPIEKCDSKDKGMPMYLWDVLNEDLSEFGTSEYKYKMRIIDFLKSKDKVK